MGDGKTEGQILFPLGNDSAAEVVPGAAAGAPWAMPWRGWRAIFMRMPVMIGFHSVGLLAAGVAFYGFLALTPLILSTVMIYGLVGDLETVRANMATLTELVPPEAALLIEEQLVAAVTTASGVTGLALVVSLSLALYGAQRAASGLIGALNIINGEHETRNFLKLTLLSMLLTLATVLIAVAGLVSASLFAIVETALGDTLGSATTALIKVATWLAAFLFGSLGFAVIMRFGPDRRPAKWRWLTPGSLLATLLWVAVSFGFSLYVAYISDYNATYGSLAAIVVFLMWLFLSAFAVLLGALLNVEIERQTLIDTTTGPDRPMGERGAVIADSGIAERVDGELLAKRRARQAQHAARRAGAAASD